MARKSHKKRKHKRMDKKSRNERSGAIARRKRERKRGQLKFIDLRAYLTKQFD